MEEHILAIFKACDAVWIHNGDPKKPHAELTSGLCSNGYFDCPRVLKYPNYCEALAQQLVRKLRENGVERPDWVIGTAYTAITFSYEVAKTFEAIHGFVEKDPQNPKKMVWERLNIPEGSTVLQIDEVVTTGQSFLEGRRAIQKGNEGEVNFLSIVGAIVHRPVRLPADYKVIKVVALVEKEIQVFKTEECPLCKAGSPRHHPKTHWKELTGKR